MFLRRFILEILAFDACAAVSTEASVEFVIVHLTIWTVVQHVES